MHTGPDGSVYIGELSGVAALGEAPGVGYRVSVLSRDGKLLARFGDPEEGELSFTIRGSRLDPPRELKSRKKLSRDGELPALACRPVLFAAEKRARLAAAGT